MSDPPTSIVDVPFERELWTPSGLMRALRFYLIPKGSVLPAGQDTIETLGKRTLSVDRSRIAHFQCSMPIGLAYMLAFMGWVLLVLLRLKTPQTVAVDTLTRASPREAGATAQPLPSRVVQLMGLELLLTLCAAALVIAGAYTIYQGEQSTGLRYLVAGLSAQGVSYAIEFARGRTVSSARAAENNRPERAPDERAQRMTPQESAAVIAREPDTRDHADRMTQDALRQPMLDDLSALEDAARNVLDASDDDVS